jgi:hypothetical protein
MVGGRGVEREVLEIGRERRNKNVPASSASLG